MSKRKHVFRNDYEKEFDNLKQSRKARAMLTAAIAIVKSNLRPWEKQLLVHTMLPQDKRIMLGVLHQTNQ